MGYEGLELTQYESWTPARGREVRTLLDSLKLKVFATHTEPEYFMPGDKMKAAIELNHILGTQTVCCVRGLATTPTGIGYHAKASAEADAWKELTDVLQSAAETLKRNKMACSFHNHAVEFQTKDGVRPIDILARIEGPALSHRRERLPADGHRPGGIYQAIPGKNRMPAAHRRSRGCQPSRAAAWEGRQSRGRMSSRPPRAWAASSITCSLTARRS